MRFVLGPHDQHCTLRLFYESEYCSYYNIAFFFSIFTSISLVSDFGKTISPCNDSTCIPSDNVNEICHCACKACMYYIHIWQRSGGSRGNQSLPNVVLKGNDYLNNKIYVTNSSYLRTIFRIWHCTRYTPAMFRTNVIFLCFHGWRPTRRLHVVGT